MATTRTDLSDDGQDARAHLAMLARAQDATEAAAWMPPTPVWHAPILATAIAGLTLANNGPDGWAIPGTAIGSVALTFGFLDQLRRQRASPRRIRRPLRVLTFCGFIVAVSCAVVLLWGRIDLPDRSIRSTLTMVGAWIATVAVFAIGITTTNRVRQRWTGPPR